MEDPIYYTDLVEEIAANYSLNLEDAPEEELDPVIPHRSAQVLSAIQIIKEWDEQHKGGSYVIFKPIQAFEKHVKRVQAEGLEQRTLASYFA